MRRTLIRALLLAVVLSALGASPAYAQSPAVGWLDTVGTYTDGMIRVTGWAATADAPQASLGIRVKIDGQLSLLAYKVGQVYRPDVRAFLGSRVQ